MKKGIDGKNNNKSEQTTESFVKRIVALKSEEDKDVINFLDSQLRISDYIRKCVHVDLSRNAHKTYLPTLERLRNISYYSDDQEAVEALTYCIRWLEGLPLEDMKNDS